jgi:hypothetical protein
VSVLRLLVAVLAGGAAIAAQSAPSGADVLAHCRSIEAPTARLACYDAAAGRQATAAGAAAPAASDAAPRDPQAERAAMTRNFGLTPAQVNPTQPQGPEAISARITGIGGAAGHAIVTLDNGQVWSVTDDATRLSVGDAVTIRRGALGSFLMTTGDRHAYTVHRSR